VTVIARVGKETGKGEEVREEEMVVDPRDGERGALVAVVAAAAASQTAVRNSATVRILRFMIVIIPMTRAEKEKEIRKKTKKRIEERRGEVREAMRRRGRRRKLRSTNMRKTRRPTKKKESIKTRTRTKRRKRLKRKGRTRILGGSWKNAMRWVKRRKDELLISGFISMEKKQTRKLSL
jgi:hypothetical protein